MTEFFFPDNTVLCNFAAVDRLDLLRSVLDGRGRWTEAVAYEASRSASASARSCAACRRRLAGRADRDRLRTPTSRRSSASGAPFRRNRRRPLQHLGEAQTCYVILNWDEFAGSWWITDDREALATRGFRGSLPARPST